MISYDGTSCSDKCIYPDLFDSKSKKCLQTCGTGTIPDETASPITCIESKDCQKSLSSDKTSCVTDCSFVKESDPKADSNIC